MATSAVDQYDCMSWAMQKAAPKENAMVTIARVALFAEFILTEWAAPAGIGLDGGKMPIHGRESFVRSLGFLSELLRLTQDQLLCWDNPNKFLRFCDWRRMA